jgi:hypothetical protein
MNTFLLDILEDLREKRLVPVALLLALGIVATPALLMKRGGEPAKGAPAAASASTVASPQVKALTALADVQKGDKLNIRNLAAKNPFDAPVPKLKSLESAASVAGAKSSETVAGGGETLSSGGGGGGTTLPSVPTGGDKPAETPHTEGDNAPSRPKKVTYSFVVDATFGTAGHRRERNGLSRFAMLPNEGSPMLVYLGVDSDESHALFLLDATLSHSGEGTCADDACSFISLGVGNEHSFTDQAGDTYLLRLDQIRRVRVKAAASSRIRARTSVGDTRDRAERKQATEGARRFLSPLFGDLVQTDVQD